MPTQTLKNLYVLLAREVSTDASDNMNSIIKIIDKFTFNVNLDELEKSRIGAGSKQVALPINYAVATAWLFKDKTGEDTFLNFKVSIFDDEDNDLGGPEQENVLPAGLNRVSMNFNMQGLPVGGSGMYRLVAEVHSKEGKLLAKAECPFEVELIDGPAQ